MEWYFILLREILTPQDPCYDGHSRLTNDQDLQNTMKLSNVECNPNFPSNISRMQYSNIYILLYIMRGIDIGIRTRPELNFALVPELPVKSGTGTGSKLCYRDRYQALSLVPITKMDL